MESIEKIREVAARSRVEAKNSYDTMTSEALSWARWLTASLLAVNGAGAAAILNSYDKINKPIWPAGLFVAGILFAMFSGWVLQVAYHRQIVLARSLMEFWNSTELNGAYDQEKYAEIFKESKKSLRFSWVAPTAGWVSILMFILAVIVLAVFGDKANSAEGSGFALEIKVSG